jgi:hypothetical protein
MAQNETIQMKHSVSWASRSGFFRSSGLDFAKAFLLLFITGFSLLLVPNKAMAAVEPAMLRLYSTLLKGYVSSPDEGCPGLTAIS